MSNPFLSLMAFLGLASPAAVVYPAGQLAQVAQVDTTATSQHPFLLTNRAQATAFLTAAQTDPGKARALLRLQVGVKADLANTALIKALETPYAGTDITQYMARFSVASQTGGAAQFALSLAYYAYLTDLNMGYGDHDLAIAARNQAGQILYIWAALGFRPNGQPITDFKTFTQTNADGSAVSTLDANSSVNLQIGRGMLAFVVAYDLLNDRPWTGLHKTVVDGFLVRMRDMLIPAANNHYDSSPYMNCHRYDNQADTGLTDLLALAAYTGDTPLISDLAGVPTAPPLLEWSWPQQIEGQVYGNGESARTCDATTTAYVKYNPNAAAGEITDRERNEPYQAFGYTTGSMESLMQAARIFRSSGFDAYHYTGWHGQGIEMALDYYSQYYTSYAVPTLAYLPATGTIPDFAQYAGDVYTRAAPGVAVTGADGIIWPYVIGSTLYPSDTKLQAALAHATSMGTVDILPISAPDTFSMLLWGATSD